MQTTWWKFRSLWKRRSVKREIDEELRFHTERGTAENIAAGMTPEEAAREARKRFGNWQSVREECRDVRGASFGEALWQDVRFCLRVLRKNAGFASITATTLALGIAANIVIFTIYSALYLRPFPFVDSSRLVDLDETAPRWNVEYTGLAYPDFAAWREHNRSFQGMAVWCYRVCDIAFEGSLDRVTGVAVTHDLTSVLGIKPILGRSIAPDEDRPGGANVVLLGNAFWKRQFGAKTDVIGKTLKLSQQAFTIIGVLPPDRDMLVEGEFWVPLAMDPNNRQTGWFLRGVGRLKAGVNQAVAQEDLRRVHLGLVEKHQASDCTSPRLTVLSERYFGDARRIVQVMLGAVGVVLLIGCGNAAALMLARGLARTREFALRQSLGATPGRLARLIGMESLLLASLGGLLGVPAGHWGLRLLLRSLPETPPRWVSFDMDWRIGLFVALMVALAALLGALPVLRSTLSQNLHANLQSSGQQSTTAGSGRRSLHLLVVAELALTLILMIQAGLLVQTFHALRKVDPGFRPDHVLIYGLALPPAKYGSSEATEAFYRDHLDRLRGLPGVVSAGAANLPPLGGHTGTFYTIENAPPKRADDPQPVVLKRVAWPGYFETMGIPIVAGRGFNDQDGRKEGSQAVIVDEAFAKRSWPNNDPVGKRIRNHDNAPWLTVVGVARDVKHYGLDQPGRPGVYLPFAQQPQSDLSIVVRSSVLPTSLVPSVRALLSQSDPDLAMLGTVTMEERFSQAMWARRLTASLFGIFSATALIMALGGIYGVFSYVVSRRTQEIGVRLALGAQPREVLWLVTRQALGLATTGIVIGWLGAALLAPLMRSLVIGVSPFDPLTFVGIALLLTAVSLLACWVPACRAMKVQPMVALRCE